MISELLQTHRKTVKEKRKKKKVIEEWDREIQVTSLHPGIHLSPIHWETLKAPALTQTLSWHKNQKNRANACSAA